MLRQLGEKTAKGVHLGQPDLSGEGPDFLGPTAPAYPLTLRGPVEVPA